MTAAAAPLDSSDASNQLVSEWESVLAKRKDASELVPTPLQFYKLGSILYSLNELPPDSMAVANVHQAYHQLLDALPTAHRKDVFRDLHRAVVMLLEQAPSDTFSQDVHSALESLAGLYKASPLPTETTAQPLETMAALTDVYALADRSQRLILSLLSQFLWAPAAVEWEQLLAAIDRIQNEPDVWTDLVEWETERDSDWRIKITSRYQDETQRDYLSGVLSMNEEESNAPRRTNGDSILPQEQQQQQSSSATAATKPQDEIQRRIDQVRQVLPDLGEGFVEAALSSYKGNVEQTLQALLDEPSSWPAPLQIMDRTLPRRHRNVTTAKQEEEARLTAKVTLQAAERQQQQEAAAVQVVLRSSQTADEYNDDYDDQYDDTEGFGGADSGLYDDFETVRTYNRVVQNVEQEQSFWQDNVNTNRSNGGPKKIKTGETAFRGPDKGRGGRVPNAGRGGRGGRGAGRGSTAVDKKKGGAKVPIAKQKGSGDATKEEGSSKPNQRHKANKLASRREQQKKALAKRSG